MESDGESDRTDGMRWRRLRRRGGRRIASARLPVSQSTLYRTLTVPLVTPSTRPQYVVNNRKAYDLLLTGGISFLDNVRLLGSLDITAAG